MRAFEEVHQPQTRSLMKVHVREPSPELVEMVASARQIPASTTPLTIDLRLAIEMSTECAYNNFPAMPAADAAVSLRFANRFIRSQKLLHYACVDELNVRASLAERLTWLPNGQPAIVLETARVLWRLTFACRALRRHALSIPRQTFAVFGFRALLVTRSFGGATDLLHQRLFVRMQRNRKCCRQYTAPTVTDGFYRRLQE
jgi:hypothetical protein